MEATALDLPVGIIGTGTMGRGIAQLAAACGCRVVLADAQTGAAAAARTAVAGTFAMLVGKGKMTTAAADAATQRLVVADSVGGDFADCAVVIEAIVENIEAKRDLFTQLERVVADDCVLATNTSSLCVAAVAASCRRPERVAGFHFFNPVPLMRVVEVIAGCRTEPGTVDFLKALASRMGHLPVVVADTPGFLVNHAGRGFGPEALRIVAEGVAQPVEIDLILTEQAGFRMGPFELYDLVGLDIAAAVADSLYEQFFHEPRYRPSHLLRPRVAAGLLGRKTGQGFYRYLDGRAIRPTEPPPPQAPDLPVWVSPASLAPARQLADILAAAGVEIDGAAKPGPDSLCLVLPMGLDATSAALAEDLPAERVVAVDALFGFRDRRRVAMTTPATRPEMRAAAWRALSKDGTPVSLINDSAGFVAQRILAMIVNIACDIAQQRIASPTDIDAAVTRALGYPHGPLAWGDSLGASRILSILEAIFDQTGDPRWRPSPWLRRRARLNLPLSTAEPEL